MNFIREFLARLLGSPQVQTCPKCRGGMYYIGGGYAQCEECGARRVHELRELRRVGTP